MRSVEARIRAEIERAVAMILDQHVQGTTAAQSREYIARLRKTAGALIMKQQTSSRWPMKRKRCCRPKTKRSRR